MLSFFILWKVEIYRPKSYTEVVYDSLYGFTITFTEACIISNLIDLYNDERLKNMWKIKCNIEKYYIGFSILMTFLIYNFNRYTIVIAIKDRTEYLSNIVIRSINFYR